jgi:hypothetical protein
MTCFYSWDTFYDLMDILNDKLGRIVPLILTIGNHDVGYNALADVKINFNNIEKIPYYFSFHPQHTSNNKIPNVTERKSYHYHVLGPTVHVHLDSGYIATYEDQ